MRLEIAANKKYTFTVPVSENGVDVTPLAGRVSVHDANGNAVLANKVAVVSPGLVSYTIAAQFLASVGKNFVIVFSIYFSDRPGYDVPIVLDVVKYPLRNDVADADLFAALGRLRDEISVAGMVKQSTVSTFSDTNLIGARFGLVGGALVIFIGDTPVRKIVTGYDADTGLISFAQAEAVPIPVGTRFVIRTNYREKIDTAFSDVQSFLRERYGYASAIIDAKAVKRLVVLRAVSLACLDLCIEPGDVWDKKYAEFSKLYDEARAAFNEPVDLDSNGSIDNEEDSASKAHVSHIGTTR